MVHVIAEELSNLTPLLDDLVRLRGEGDRLEDAQAGPAAGLVDNAFSRNRHPRNIQPIREAKTPHAGVAGRALPKGRNFR